MFENAVKIYQQLQKSGTINTPFLLGVWEGIGNRLRVFFVVVVVIAQPATVAFV